MPSQRKISIPSPAVIRMAWTIALIIVTLVRSCTHRWQIISENWADTLFFHNLLSISNFLVQPSGKNPLEKQVKFET
jgi:hypothetical protein